MASLFQRYFQASSMPKRLLQYALSRLEILDTDALDLENLDIAWGKNSVFEFKDVGLRLRKLETLLQLPNSFEILRARVLLLRLTIPVDIYSSPIVVEVDGVEAHLRIKPQPEKGTTSTSHTNHDRKRGQAYSRTSSSTQVHTKGRHARRASNFEDDLDPAIPTAADLAESFLQAEPVEEKAELEAAILSETQELGNSVLSDDGEIPVGTGAGLGLPGFVASFLQAIVDRLQVRINGVIINLDIDIPNESPRSTATHPSDPVTVQLKVDNVDIEGVTHEVDKVSSPANEQPRNIYKKGKRLICLSKIRGALISEANLFSSLARSSALSSPSAAYSDVFDERKPQKSYASTQGSTSRSSDGASSPEEVSTTSSRRPSAISLQKGSVGHRSLHASTIASDGGRFEDAPEDENSRSLSGSLTGDSYSEGGDSIFQNSAFLDQVTESQYSEDGESLGGGSPSRSFAKDAPPGPTPKSALSTPRASMHLPPTPDRDTRFDIDSGEERGSEPMLQSTILPSRQHHKFSRGRVSHSQPTLSSPARPAAALSATHEIGDAVESGEEDDTITPLGEDLAESQLFSHEDAESMYMSAVSHGSSGNMPGGWAGSDGPSSPPVSPTATETKQETLDNLEHARSNVSIPSAAEEHSSAPSSPSVSHHPHRSRRVSSSSPVKRQRVPAMPHIASSVSEPSTASSDEYAKMTKEIFHLDQMSIYVPGMNPEPSVDSPDIPLGSTMFSSTFDGNDPSRSTSVNVPGAFSAHLPSSSQRRTASVVQRAVNPEPVEKNEVDLAIEVDVGEVMTQFDISVGRLIFKLIQRVKEALKQDAVSSESKKSDEAPTGMNFKITAQQISLKFLERLEGISGPAHIAYDGGQVVPPPESDVLLRTKLSGLQVDTRTASVATETIVKLKKFVFGYALENILSFDANLQMRASVRDLKASDGVDVILKIINTAEATRYDISTLPMHVSIDLQKLDDTFSWFGGLSSVLNMGSSMASNATITGHSPSKSKPRGVRFESPIKPNDRSLAAQNKADVRIGGFVLDLIGTECSVGVETSSIKVVSRDEGIGVAVHKIMLSGPHLKLLNEDPAITVDVTGTRIEYLPTPKDVDLDRLLSLITPSKAKYDQDDDILLDMLLRQRKQGAVLRLTVDDFQTRIERLDKLSYLPELGEEVARLSTVAKYLPDDERPGLLSLITVRKVHGYIDVNPTVGILKVAMRDLEVAQITLPALVAFSIGTVTAHRNVSEELIGSATDPEQRELRSRSPVIMARMIGDEMEPVVKIKLWNLKLEYRVPTLMVLLGLAESASPQDVSASLSASVATLTDLARGPAQRGGSKATIRAEKSGSPHSKPMIIDVVLRDCILGLNPLELPSKILVVLTETHLAAVLSKDQKATLSAEMGKGSILVIDNVANILSGDAAVRPKRQSFDGGSTQVADLCLTGFVSVSYISSARAVVNAYIGDDGEKAIDVELRDDLFVLESCADSTQTLVLTLNALTPPTPPSKETKYRTKVIPVQDLLASLSGDAFGTAEGDYNFDDDFAITESGDIPEGEEPDEFDMDSHYYQNPGEQYNETIFDDGSGSATSTQLSTRDTQDGVLLDSFVGPTTAEEDNDAEPLEFQDNHFGTGSIVDGTAHRWNSSKNTYDTSNAYKVKKSPLKVAVRDVHIIWNLFDGYDWQHTRDTITKAVQDVESKALEKRARNERRPAFEQDIEDEETVIGDFLFNSIYIGIPANRDPRELAAAINQGLNDDATETESIATTSLSSSPSRPGVSRRPKTKRLHLNRSKHHKITFEMKGVSVDLVAFPPDSGETQSSVDVRVHDLEIFDHVPTSTWRKFATYMQDAGIRETGSSMIHIEILNVKPVPELAASELVLKATILPLRLHVDQDALDFITRFFEFKDDSAPTNPTPGDLPFLQRVEVNSVQVKLDFKPKRVDYAGLRSGHTTEFMNFLILDEADMVLRHTIIYGISGFDKLGKCLNDIWMPEIKRNQLPGILAGLAPVRSIVNVGGGLRQLVVVPYREYQKDRRIARSLSKGAAVFAKTTGTELVKLGAKVAIGVQTILQGAEGFLGPEVEAQMGEGEEEDEETKQISLYANQPVGVLQGLRGGYDGLQRDLILARDAIIAVPGEAMESGTAAGVVRAVRKHAPTVILRPAIGVAKAGGQILMGATNSLDPVNLQRADA
ncbi:Autophagy-related 2, partial [Hyphodiscus hymeniophilus]